MPKLPRRLKSRLSSIALVVTLLLFAATLILWARGYWARDGIWYSSDARRSSVHSYRGRIWFWTISGNQTALRYIWNTPAKLTPGFVWDSTPDSYYVNAFKSTKAAFNPEPLILGAPAMDYPPGPESMDRKLLGFRVVRSPNWLPIAQLSMGYPTARSLAIYVPHWAIALFLGTISGVMSLRVMRRRRRVATGHCIGCGYDLRASPGRCPECGLERVQERNGSEYRP